MDNLKKLKDILVEFISVVSIHLPDDVYHSLEAMANKEDGRIGNELYGCIFDNLEKAKTLGRPLCQDTGVLQFFIKAGTKFPYLDELEETIIEATKEATEKTPLRHNVVECFTEENTGNNVGTRAPFIEWEIIPHSDELHIDLYLAGGGCSLPGRSKVLMPLEGYEGIVKYVFDTIVEWGVNACPPLVVGVGIGTCSATAALLSKKALLRPVGTHNPNPLAADMEKRMKKGLDKIGIGPLGLTGKESVQAVNIEYAAHHPATLGVGITVGCWATRRGAIDIRSDLSYDIPSHKEAR
ncbi:MAG: L(+)-tartrate dehydratase subunit alpha [Clostridiales bacterium]|jgi:L(+)-tartrate dehydratase alpha subunit|nr:L(+)-tartrate dehydratase subunit alpha [Clostridiales bacterium]HOB64626.1 L(+)-tartrate dehydratase subunit alpha [Clostridia bacterium]HOK82308.1 L(+)-tartrate dehydratase subunit alpha [Clostridia bacterium]HOL61085.1 L(+)-tartrate dehydratase subunit alpha [Clostridia bacterium]HPO53781.1 L(+)-tartrate dehydratase subunit alpha [Clostridia bacterium]